MSEWRFKKRKMLNRDFLYDVFTVLLMSISVVGSSVIIWQSIFTFYRTEKCYNYESETFKVLAESKTKILVEHTDGRIAYMPKSYENLFQVDCGGLGFRVLPNSKGVFE